MSDAIELMERHIEALYTLDATGHLVRIRTHNGGPAPRVFIGTTEAGTVHRFREDVPEDMRAKVIGASASSGAGQRGALSAATSTDIATLSELLSSMSPVESASAGPAYVFPAAMPPIATAGDVVRITADNVALLNANFHEWIPDVHQSPPLIAVIVDGHAVAVCASVRITPRAHEAGVETAPTHRKRGYATLAAAAWARAVRALGAEPMYSTSWDNTASQAVARKLGLVHFGSDLHIT